jgi:hypothetical protein
MKENTVNIRTSEEDEDNLKQAAENLSILNDDKPSLSKAIREGVKLLAEQDPTKPELFYVNRRALRDLEVNLEYGKQHLQLIYDEYLRATGNPPTMEEIQSWFGANKSNFLVANEALIREGILHKMYLEQKAKYPGLQFTYENVIIPDLNKLLEVCGQLIFIPEIEYRERMFWQCYKIAKDKIELIPEAIETVKNQYRVYAITPEEKARLAGMRKLCIILDTIRLSNPSQLNIPGFAVYDNEAGVFTPAENYIKGYIK